METINVNPKVFSRHLAKHLPNKTYMVFNLLNKDNASHFEIVKTDNTDLNQFCDKNGKDFVIDDIDNDLNINNQFNISFN